MSVLPGWMWALMAAATAAAVGAVLLNERTRRIRWAAYQASIPGEASKLWLDWTENRRTFTVTGADSNVCPYCYYGAMVVIASQVGLAHGDSAARYRWMQHRDHYLRLQAALGGCRCGKHL